MKGALPPSSSDSFFTVSAHWRSRIRPTSVDPVNETFRTTGLVHISRPISGDLSPLPTTTLNTPGGKPACSASTTSASAESGVASAGFATTVQPAANAGATLRVIIAIGKFQGVIAAHTPMPCLIASSRRSGAMVGITSP